MNEKQRATLDGINDRSTMTYGQALAQAKAEAYTRWFETHDMEVFIGADDRFHAGPNGAEGANGEFYSPGQWVATSEDTIKGAMGDIHKYAASIAHQEWVQDPINAKFEVLLNAYTGTNRFFASLQSQLSRKGALSEAQVAAGNNAFQRDAEQGTERAEKAKRDSGSEHVGTVGERRLFTVTVEVVLTFNSMYGYWFLNICRDADDNVIVYKGSKPFDKGSKIIMKATVKEHGEYQGTKQTIVSRPKIQEED